MSFLAHAQVGSLQHKSEQARMVREGFAPRVSKALVGAGRIRKEKPFWEIFDVE